MATQKIPQNLEDDFAKKCRTALEKSWGIEIPKPSLKQKSITLRAFCEENSSNTW
jgi:hypothetical protein